MDTRTTSRRGALGALGVGASLLAGIPAIIATTEPEAKATTTIAGPWTAAYQKQKALWNVSADADTAHVIASAADKARAKFELERSLDAAKSALREAIETPTISITEAADKIEWGIEDGCCDDEIIAAGLADLRRLLAKGA
jgi:hypothetical protein